MAGEVIGVASVRSCSRLPPCVTEPMPAGSKADLLLAKTEPGSDSGSTSGIMHLGRGKKIIAQKHLWPKKRGVRICEQNSPADCKDGEEQEGRGAGADIHLQPTEGPYQSRVLEGHMALWREEHTLKQVCCQDL